MALMLVTPQEALPMKSGMLYDRMVVLFMYINNAKGFTDVVQVKAEDVAKVVEILVVSKRKLMILLKILEMILAIVEAATAAGLDAERMDRAEAAGTDY